MKDNISSLMIQSFIGTLEWLNNMLVGMSLLKECSIFVTRIISIAVWKVDWSKQELVEKTQLINLL